MCIIGSFGMFYLLAGTVIFVTIGFVIPRKDELIITDKIVSGKTMSGKQVDIPVDSISAVGMGWFNTVAVASSAGKIRFAGVEDKDKIYSTINSLLSERSIKQNNTINNIVQPKSDADELVKFKELLDNGIISQEEFEAKKKQLLGV